MLDLIECNKSVVSSFLVVQGVGKNDMPSHQDYEWRKGQSVVAQVRVTHASEWLMVAGREKCVLIYHNGVHKLSPRQGVERRSGKGLPLGRGVEILKQKFDFTKVRNFPFNMYVMLLTNNIKHDCHPSTVNNQSVIESNEETNG